MAITFDLFDKIINLRMYREDGSVVTIETPATGRKPSIRISGTLVTQDIMQQIELRITNFVSDQPLDQYKYITIEAGYRTGVTVGFRVQVLVAFQELPGPDGVTCFTCLLGDIDSWRTTTFSGKYTAGSLLKNVLQDVASQMGMDLEYSADETLQLKIDIYQNGLAKDLFPKLIRNFTSYTADGAYSGIRIAPYGNKILCFNANKGTGVVHVLNFIAHAKHSAKGYDIQAPWVPPARPGDSLQIDPKYFRQDFGGSQVAAGNLFQIYSVAFEFATDDDTNQMTVLTVGAA